MNSTRVLAGEYTIAIAFVCWGAIKNKMAPWPPAIIYTSAAFGILGIFAYASPELAATLGAGFLLAALVRIMSKEETYIGGFPETDKSKWTWVPISF